MKSGNKFSVVVTAEHASGEIPARYKGLGLGVRLQRSHIAWDEGSTALARTIAKKLNAPLVEGKVSRLVIDLNRSLHHRRVIPSVAFGVPVPGNQLVDEKEREFRIKRYYEPFRTAAFSAIEQAIKTKSRCVHISCHTFTPQLDGVVRPLDAAILYDPRKSKERALAERLTQRLTAAGLRVRRNFPFRGVADGHTTGLRRIFSDKEYAGIEIELNQSLLGRWKEIVETVSKQLREELD